MTLTSDCPYAMMQIMLTIGRGQHGSTYGGNPVAARVALAALQVIVDENLTENSYRLGQLLRHELQTIPHRIVPEVRVAMLKLIWVCAGIGCLESIVAVAVLPSQETLLLRPS